MPIVIASALCFPSRTLCRRMLFFFMAGLLLHFECVSIGSLSHPAGGRPSHTISESAISIISYLPSRDQRERSEFNFFSPPTEGQILSYLGYRVNPRFYGLRKNLGYDRATMRLKIAVFLIIIAVFSMIGEA